MPHKNEWVLKGHSGCDGRAGNTENGKFRVYLTVPFTEKGADGNDYTVWYKVFVYGKAAEQAVHVKKGDAVCCYGKPFVLKGKTLDGNDVYEIGMTCFYMEHINWHKTLSPGEYAIRPGFDSLPDYQKQEPLPGLGENEEIL